MNVYFHSSPPIDTNVFFLICPITNKMVIIDAPYEILPALQSTLKKTAASPVAVLLTHSHWDHVGGLQDLLSHYDIPFYIHKFDKDNLEYPGSDGVPLYQPLPSIKPKYFLEDDQQLSFGSLNIKVIHTPGHSPGSVCFYFGKEGLLFSGDTLFKGGTGRLDFPSSQKSLMPKSLNKLSQLPKETLVYPGHGPSTFLKNENWLYSVSSF